MTVSMGMSMDYYVWFAMYER